MSSANNSTKLLRHVATSALSSTKTQRGESQALSRVLKWSSSTCIRSSFRSAVRHSLHASNSPFSSASPIHSMAGCENAASSFTTNIEDAAAETHDTALLSLEGESSPVHLKSSKETQGRHREESSGDNIVRTGYVQWMDVESKCGVIVQDDKYKSVGPVDTHKVFFHFTDIDHDSKPCHHFAKFLMPVLNRDVRVRFQARNQSGRKYDAPGLKAFNIRYEGGDAIPLLHYDNGFDIIRAERAKLGLAVFHIMEKVDDPKDMVKMANKAFDVCKERVEWAKSQISDPVAVKKQVKAEFGQEVFHLLENATNIHDLKLRVDDAFFLCRKRVREIEREISPKEPKDEVMQE